MTPEEADEMSKYTGTMSEWITHPSKLWPKFNKYKPVFHKAYEYDGRADVYNPEYVNWLEQQYISHCEASGVQIHPKGDNND